MYILPSKFDMEENKNGKIQDHLSNENSINHDDSLHFTFTPQQAHIFGGQSIFLSFSNLETTLSDEIFYYVIFEGSNLRHITSAKVLNPYTLQAVVPDHDEAELVILSVCHHSTSSSIDMMASDTFVFTSDSSQFLSQQLALNVSNPDVLLNLENVYSSLLDISADEKRILDAKLTTSFRNIKLPNSWSLVTEPADEKQKSWTLLHFCAKYTLPLLAEYLLTKRGVKLALELTDKHGRTALDIAMLKNNKRLTEILSRSPCEEEEEESEVNSDEPEETKRPSIKRHKLGTTTITNTVSDSKEGLFKDLMLLKELDKLASSTQDSSTENGILAISEESSPLAESLKKLHEINEEIRRLRSMSYKDNMEYEKDPDDCTDTNANFLPETTIEETETIIEEGPSLDESFIDVSELNESSNDSQAEQLEVETSLEEQQVTKEKIEEDNTDEEDFESDEVSTESPVKQPDLERRCSNVSVGKIEDIAVDVIEILPTSFEEIVPVAETVLEVKSVNTEHSESSPTPELNFKLESVTEETEEELQADGSPFGKRQKHNEVNISVTRSLTDLPPHPPKRVGILKRTGYKKDRPLSDSFENLRMVEKQGIVDFYQGGLNVENAPRDAVLIRGHSLDALMNEADNEGANSEPSTTSQLSLNERNDSQDSLTSDNDSPKSWSRSGSEKHRASSMLSLTDALSRHYSYGSSQEDLRSVKKSSLFSRITFKKAKSMSSLDTKDKTLEEDRRKTIHTEFSFLSSKQSSKNKDESRRFSNDDVDGDEHISHEDMCGDILVRCVSYDVEVKKSQSSCSIDAISKVEEKEKEKPRNRRVSTSAIPNRSSIGSQKSNQSDDELTDDGISSEVSGRHILERKPSNDDKRKKKYGLFGGKDKKEKKAHKEKEKEKEKKDKEFRERKDSDSKSKKKAPTSKTDFVLPVKTDSKSSFLTKRGSSFRQNFNKSSSSDSKLNDKQMFTRGSSTSSNTKYDANNKFLRSSDRRSPVSGRKISAAIYEEPREENDHHSLPLSRNLGGGSRTSLDSLGALNDDDTDAPYIPDNEYDSDLDAQDVPETWSDLVDKKIQRKMHAKDIKRQDVIYELIQTEAQYVRVLNIMRKIYARGMIRSLNMDPDIVHQIFPVLDELIELNGNFIKAMKKRQSESPNYCIESIGDILFDFFGGENGEMLKQAYGHFCSQHLEAVAIYKDMLKDNKKFANFMKQCILNDRARRLSVPECITYVTIRMTKYPLLIEAIIKATKESKPDYDHLKSSLKLVKEVLVAVDEAVNIFEQQKELALLKKNLDRKNVVEIKIGNTKAVYKTTKLFHKRSRLLYDKKTTLRGKSKSYDARMIVLAEKIIFFQDNGGGKLQLLSADNKAPVLSLKNLMVREVATDNKALFLVSTSKDAAQIYEIVCDSYRDKKDFMPKLQGHIKNCPDEEEENLTDLEEEARREEEERVEKLKKVVDQLQIADEKVTTIISDKTRLVQEMRELIESMDDVGPIKGSSCTELKPVDITTARKSLESCLIEVNQLANTVCLQQVEQPLPSPSTPSPSLSSTSINSITKRSDTFAGHEQRGMKSSNSYGNVNRVSSMRPSQGKIGTLETDSGKPRRQSQLLSVLSRTKTMGSNEDLTSLSSSTSTTSLSTISTTLSQINLFQDLKDNLSELVDVTNKQDVEIGKMRLELQESRNEASKLKNDKKELEEKLVSQQKDNDRQVRHEKEQYAKLAREFKRTTEKLYRQIDERKVQYNQLLDTYNNDVKIGVHNGGKPNPRSNSEDARFV